MVSKLHKTINIGCHRKAMGPSQVFMWDRGRISPMKKAERENRRPKWRCLLFVREPCFPTYCLCVYSSLEGTMLRSISHGRHHAVGKSHCAHRNTTEPALWRRSKSNLEAHKARIPGEWQKKSLAWQGWAQDLLILGNTFTSSSLSFHKSKMGKAYFPNIKREIVLYSAKGVANVRCWERWEWQVPRTKPLPTVTTRWRSVRLDVSPRGAASWGVTASMALFSAGQIQVPKKPHRIWPSLGYSSWLNSSLLLFQAPETPAPMVIEPFCSVHWTFTPRYPSCLEWFYLQRDFPCHSEKDRGWPNEATEN